MKHITDSLEIEKEQVAQLLVSAQACSFRDYLMLRVLRRTWKRVSELLNIRPRDIEAHNQVVNIVKAKRGKQRWILLDNETLTMLSKYVLDTNTPRGLAYLFCLKRMDVAAC